ncbi:MAG: extracellular solute-binding protein [Lachnospiraceae bacterium]|nr:extracellular solute-binding protein [Lachnospiraceae bacterium]
MASEGCVKYRLFTLFVILASVLLLAACEGPRSPVGRSKVAQSIRDSLAKRAAKGAEEISESSLSAGLSGRVSAATAEMDSVSEDTVTDGDPDGTKLVFWTYDPAHVAYYRKLLGKWNDEDPDYTLEITFKVMPYNELHDTFLATLKMGEGAPDLCDIDAYSFAEVSEGLSDWLYPLDAAAAPYIYFMHPARMDVYKGSDDKRYAVPFRMGAAVQYWNMELLEEVGITQKEVDAVKTWEDYSALGEKFKAAKGPGAKYFTAVDPEDPLWPMLALAEYSGEPEKAGSAKSEMTAVYQGWMDAGTAKRTENIAADIASGNVASFTGSLAFMDNFVTDMHDQYGKWYITKCPVFTDGQPCSVCLDDSATVITAQSRAAALAADYVCYAKMYTDNTRSILWPDLSYDICNTELWSDEAMTHDATNEYNTFFRNYPYDVLKEINERIAMVKP